MGGDLHLMNTREINQRILLIRAQAQGWEGPDYSASLDELVHDARRWLTRWGSEEELASHDIAGPMHETNSYWSIYVGNDA